MSEEILKELKALREDFSDVKDRLERVEAQNTGSDNAAPLVPPCDVEPGAANIQRQFEVVKEKLSRVELPKEFKVPDSRQGFKKTEQSSLNILLKSAKFAETTIKLLKEKHDHMDDAVAADLLTIQAAHINYLKSEHASLLVQSTFDDKVCKLYKTLDNNTASFSNSQLGILKTAVELESAGTQFTGRGPQPYNPRFAFPRRGRWPQRPFNHGFRHDFPQRPTQDE